jgi:anti-sigma factor RsiW
MCEQREQLLEFLYDEGAPTSRREVERHLEACDECRDEIRAFRHVREDLLAWGVPNPPSVWTAFAPAPSVPWHKQVPAWALAAAASVMLVVGSAGGYFAHSVLDGSTQPPSGVVNSGAVTQASAIGAEDIVELIKRELATMQPDLTARPALVNNTPARPFQLDPKVEERLLGRVAELVNSRDEQQRLAIGDYLMKVQQEDLRYKRDEAQRTTRLVAQVEQLQAQVSQLVLAQAKGQGQ